jgi:hypothetical protein
MIYMRITPNTVWTSGLQDSHKSLAVYIDDDDPVEVACGCFTDKGNNIDLLESAMSFLQVESSMTMKEKL